MKIELLEEIDSTNLYIKKYLSLGEDIIVCAKRQTGGRGTKGRSFLSNEGGVYLSALRFYRDLPAKDGFRVMLNAAVAVCRVAQSYGLSPQLKWPNDVLLNGKKLCGILIENVLDGASLRASIVGIGLNVANDLSELQEIAISLSEALKTPVSVEEVRTRLISALQGEYSMEEYRSFVQFLGRDVTVIEGGKTYLAKAVAIEEDGRLRVKSAAEERLLSAAEISLRI